MMKRITLAAVAVAFGVVPARGNPPLSRELPASRTIADAPDAGAVRRQIDAHIHAFQNQKKKATLGLIQQSIALSIAYGAEAYNAGDRAACFHFYADTADSLVTAFADEKSATEPARRALADLKAARGRTLKNKDADHNAWTMRYAFDKTQIACELQVGSSQGLMRLGGENFAKSQFDEAQDAYESATASLKELDGQSLQQIPIACRFAPLALANALFAQKQYKAAAEAVTPGLRYLPEWPAITLDLRGLHHDPAEYEGLLEDLQARAKAAPQDADLQFLLGYELYFTGKKAMANEQFQRTLKIDPNHAGAKMLLHPGQRPDNDKPAPIPATEPKGTVKA